MKKLNVIITMAGEGSRFKQCGVSKAKHEIVTKQKTLFEWSVSSLTQFYDANFIFIGRRKDSPTAFIHAHLDKRIERFHVIEIDALTSGQAETAMLAKSSLTDMSDPILIFNIDTYIEPDCLTMKDVKGSGWIPYFNAEGDKWSFVDLDGDRVTRVTEKVRISEHASLGVYYFESFSLFEDAYQNFRWNSKLERYIAPMYQYLIDDLKLSVFASEVDSKRVHILGTPEDLDGFDPDWRNSIS